MSYTIINTAVTTLTSDFPSQIQSYQHTNTDDTYADTVEITNESNQDIGIRLVDQDMVKADTIMIPKGGSHQLPNPRTIHHKYVGVKHLGVAPTSGTILIQSYTSGL